MTNGFVIVVCLGLLQATTRLVRRSTCVTLDGFQEMLEVQTSDLYINLNTKGSPPPTLLHTLTHHPPPLRSAHPTTSTPQSSFIPLSCYLNREPAEHSFVQ